jgi:hypothetical protein
VAPANVIRIELDLVLKFVKTELELELCCDQFAEPEPNTDQQENHPTLVYRVSSVQIELCLVVIVGKSL